MANDNLRQEAKRLYLDEHLTPAQIAERLGVSQSTVRSWKSRDKWDSESSQRCNAATPQPYATQQSAIDNGLNDKQQLFCLYYSRTFNATRAYQKAYGCDYMSAMTAGPRMLGNVRVREEITRLKQERFAQSLLTESDIFQKFMDIAFVDITDYLDFGQETVPVMGPFGPLYDKDPDTGEKTPITKIINAVRFKESREIDGTILAEVKQGRDGASIKLADRMRALEWLADHLNMATEEQRARIDQIRAATVKLTGGANAFDDAMAQSKAIADMISSPAAERVLSDFLGVGGAADDTVRADEPETE